MIRAEEDRAECWDKAQYGLQQKASLDLYSAIKIASLTSVDSSLSKTGRAERHSRDGPGLCEDERLRDRGG